MMGSLIYAKIHSMKALELFHPLVAEWFAHKFGSPTRAQEAAWPRIAASMARAATV